LIYWKRWDSCWWLLIYGYPTIYSRFLFELYCS